MSETVRESAKKPESTKEDRTSKTQQSEYSQPVTSSVESILSLQRTIGNKAVGRLIKLGALQATLRIGQPDDIYEQRADRVADQVTGMPSSVQRKSLKCEDEVCRQPEKEKEEEETLQAKEAPDPTLEVAPDLESRIDSLKGGGRPLPESTRAFFEPRLGYDFSQVRMHTDAKAAESAKAVHALAFTVGKDVVFGEGQYAPEKNGGQKLLAHELAHVVQQSITIPGGRLARQPLEEKGESLPGGVGMERTIPADAGNITTIVAGDYVTYQIPVEGDQQLFLQVAQRGTLLRFKSNSDARPPQQTPMPVSGAFAPVILTKSPGNIEVGLGEQNRKVKVKYAAGRRIKKYHAINPENPFGPLLINREFSVHFLEAILTHPGGFERYSFNERLPDEAIGEPTWQPYVHPALGFSFRAVSGRYQGRSVTINYDEITALQALEEGAITSAKFMVELGLFAIPYVGPLILVGQALAGRTIWGDRLSTEGRVLYGLFALLPVVSRLVGATGSAAEMTAAHELAATRGITESEAIKLIRGLRTLSAEERSFIEITEAQMHAGQPLTETQARQLASLLNRIGSQTPLIFSAANDIELIWQSGRYQGRTEGAVYGSRLPVNTFLERLKAGIRQKEGMVIFQGDASRLFHAHEVEGGYSALKRLMGQQKAGFGDIIFDEAVKEGKTIIVTRAHIATAAEMQHMGQTTAWAAARLWGRRLTLEPLAVAGIASAGSLVYVFFEWLFSD